MRNRQHTSKGKGKAKSTLTSPTLPLHNGSVQSSALTGFLDSVKKLVSSLPSDRKSLLVAPRKVKQVTVEQPTVNATQVEVDRNPLHDFSEWVLTGNVFCPTGEGGGVDPTCSLGGKGSTHDGDAYFDSDVIERLEKGSYKSKEKLVRLPIDSFLTLAESLKEGPSLSKTATVKGVLDSGGKFDDVPMLTFVHDGEGVAKVTSHEGRHRALALKAKGVTHIPIKLVSSDGGGGSAIRWDQQLGGTRFDAIKGEWPSILKGESGGSIKFPVDDLRRLTTNTPPTQKNLATVVYDLMDDITKAQSTAIARTVLQGFRSDASVSKIAKELQRRLDFEPERAMVVAQTELTRVQAADALTEAGKQGNKTVRFQIGKDACPECVAKNGRVYKIKDAQNVIPVHPFCSCYWTEPITGNVFCPTGVGGGIDATCSPKGSQSPASSVKGMPKAVYQKVKTVTNKLRKKLVDRYGVKTATAIIVAAQGTSWASAAAAPFAGVPGAWVPSAITALPFIGLAELHHQITKPKTAKVLTHNEEWNMPYDDREFTEEEIQNAAWELIADLNRELGDIEYDEVNNVFCPTGKGGGRDPTCSQGGKATDRTGVRTKHRLNQLKDVIDARSRERQSDRGTGSRRVPKPITKPSERLGGETKRPSNTTSTGTGVDRSEPADPNPSRIASTAERVNEKIDRMAGFFRGKGQHEVAGWMDKLKDHVNKVGVPAALEQLGGTGKKRTDKIQYEGGWDKDAFEHTDPGRHIAAFCESYLNRHGITMTHQVGDVPDSSKSLVSSLTPSQGGTVKDHPAKSDFLPRDPKLFTDKLAESKALPGLEKSEDVNKLIGKQVTHLTKEVHEKLDSVYGKDKWIVKAYGDEAAAGYGIYFPQRSRQIAEDARNTIWASGGELGKYGFSHYRDARGIIQGIRHTDGRKYEFGSKEYDRTIDGDVRHWGDQVAKAAPNEHAASLPKGGKEFMVQPAFNVVGISEADRAAGVTIKYGQEGRTHVITRNGEVEVIPHSTWLKGDNLPVVFENADTKAMAKAAKEAIAKFPKSERDGQIYAPDLVKTVDGYKMVEANPANHTGSSGYLGNNPMIIDAYVSHVSGKEPQHVRFIRSLLSEKNKGS